MSYIENIKIKGDKTSYSPFYGSPEDAGVSEVVIDEGGSLVTRSSTLTDEGTFRINFANSSLAIPIGNITSIVGKVITGTGFSSVDVHLKDYFKLDADPESAWIQIASVDSDTQITLYDNYVGGTSGLASRSLARPFTGAGASISVLNGQGIISSGVSNNAVSFLSRAVDYAPLVFRTRLSISQRILNQNIRIGFAEGVPTPRWFARFRCEGTVNTIITCESARNPTTSPSVAETESTTITIPNGGNTNQFLDYRIEHLVETVRFYINNILVAEHIRSLPNPYDYMGSGVRIENVGTPASSTIITLDYIMTKNHNKLEMGVMSSNESMVSTQAPLTPFTFNQAGVIPINTDLMVIDCLHLRSLFIHCTSIGATGVITGQWSNDPTLASRQNGQLFDPIGGGIAGTFNTTSLRIANVIARYFILRLTTATTSGTTTLLVSCSQSTTPTYVNTQPVSGTVTANLGASSVVTNVGSTAQGASTFFSITSNATNSLTQIKSGATTVNMIHVGNISASPRYLKIFNALSASVVMGTTNATLNFLIPAGQSIPIDCGAFANRFATGFTIAITAGIANNDNTSTGTANEVVATGSLF